MIQLLFYISILLSTCVSTMQETITANGTEVEFDCVEIKEYSNMICFNSDCIKIVEYVGKGRYRLEDGALVVFFKDKVKYQSAFYIILYHKNNTYSLN